MGDRGLKHIDVGLERLVRSRQAKMMGNGLLGGSKDLLAYLKFVTSLGWWEKFSLPLYSYLPQNGGLVIRFRNTELNHSLRVELERLKAIAIGFLLWHISILTFPLLGYLPLSS